MEILKIKYIRVKPDNYTIIYKSRTPNRDKLVQLPRGDIKKFVDEKIKEGYSYLFSKANINIKALAKDIEEIEWLKSENFEFITSTDDTKKKEVLTVDSLLNQLETLETVKTYTAGAKKAIEANKGYDYSELNGTGLNGKITLADVKNHIEHIDEVNNN